MNTESLIDTFESRQSMKKAESTAETYARTAEKWAEWLANPGEKEYDDNRQDRPSKDVFQATTGDLRIFLRTQLQSGLSGGTVRNRRWAISAFYNELDEMADEDYSIPDFENPSDDLDLSDWQDLKNIGRKKEELKEDITYLSPEQVAALAENAPSPTWRNELIIRMLYQTGLRRGELADIQLSDIDRDQREISIHAEKTHLNRRVYYQPTFASCPLWLKRPIADT